MEIPRKDGLFDRLDLRKVWLLIGIGILIRLVFIGLMDLLPEEAYYWNYACHLDIGYLDHPPMVGWLNYISQAALGKSEFAVRLPAFAGWFLFAFFMYRFTRNLFDRAVAMRVVLFLTVLPIYTSIGFLMTPDAPLYVFWAGCLYFLERALIAGKNRAWIGVGLCLGLGMLSKYTIGLVIPAALAYMVFDGPSRRWFRKPQPYLGALLAIILFLPVIYWNFTQNWASFHFQGSHRWSGGIDFQLHILVGSALVLITPIGVIEAVRALVDCWIRRGRVDVKTMMPGRKYVFMLSFTIIPMIVFIIYSMQGQPKLNWTGPAWLAILPMIGQNMLWRAPETPGRWARFSGRAWRPTIIILLTFYAAGFAYIVAGLPGAPRLTGMPLPTAWEELGKRAEQLESRMESETGSEPIIIGLDKYGIASEINFYASEESDLLPGAGGEGILGGNSLMWNYWVPPETIRGRNALLISFTSDRLQSEWVTGRFERLSDISMEVLKNRFGEVGHFFWRAGYDYIY